MIHDYHEEIFAVAGVHSVVFRLSQKKSSSSVVSALGINEQNSEFTSRAANG